MGGDVYCVNRYVWLWPTVIGLLAGCGGIPAMVCRASADDAPQPRVVHAIDTYPYHLKNEAWAGANMSAKHWSVYSGATYALTGDIEHPGWRLRSTGGYGRYTYRKWTGTRQRQEQVKHTGHKYFSNVLVGYHFQRHRVTLKAFGGLATEHRVVTPSDPDGAGRTVFYGGKAALDAWLAVTDEGWLATHVSWASTFNTYKLRLQTGHTVGDGLDLGIEADLDGNRSYRAGRLGGFATWQLGDAGLTVAAGASIDRGFHPATYGSVSLFVRY